MPVTPRSTGRRTPGTHRPFVVAVALVVGVSTLASCGSSVGSSSATGRGPVRIVAGQSQYGNVAAQVGGKYVTVSSIESNPDTDPHTYEVSPEVASDISDAQIVIQNGLGYDAFMDKVEAATPSPTRKVISAQALLGLPDDTPNPHLWYEPRTMPAVAERLASDLSAIEPAHAAYFTANAARFVASLAPWLAAVAAFRGSHAGATAATTEPVADYLLQAMGIVNLTPFRFQADIMNGTDPSPQDITLESGLLTGHRVQVFCYNEQVADPLTTSVRHTARAAGVPVVAVYETMPTPGYDYQSWMLAEVDAIEAAVAHGVSTEHL
jgi:zinc/manganese transport system substrate-binding protein